MTARPPATRAPDERSASATDATATGKPHFDVLDGLRGTAALLVVLYHIYANAAPAGWGELILSHAYLAVDFFFALSGFVIGYAYDDRWGRMLIGGFLRVRLVRLHPLVVLGAALGLASYLVDPTAPAAQSAPTAMLALALALALLTLPGPPLGNRGIETHPLNGPSWTLLQEYAGSIAYALVLRRLSTRALAWLALLSGLTLLICAIGIGTLDRGWGWLNIWMAPVRLGYPFVTGLLLYRCRAVLPGRALGFFSLSLALIVIFALPTIPAVGHIRLNGVYEALCVLFLFPAIIVAGTHAANHGSTGRLCRFMGRLSYPLYITHFPFVYAWANFAKGGAYSPVVLVAAGLGLVAATIAVALAAARFWDEPIRARLRSTWT